MENRRWMYNRNYPSHGGIRQEFFDGVVEFLEFATHPPQYMSGDKIRCPCYKCENRSFLDSEDVSEHLCRKGFMEKYWNWTAHGEEAWALHERQGFVVNPELTEPVPEQMAHWDDYEHMRWDQRMVYDSVRPNFVSHPEEEAGPNNIDEPSIMSNEGGGSRNLDQSLFDMIAVSDQPRGTATASGSTSQQQPEFSSRKVFRLQPPPRRTETSPAATNDAVTTRDTATNSGSTSQQQPESEPPSRSVFRLQPAPRQTATSPPANIHPLQDNDEEEEQEEDAMGEEGVDRDGLDNDLEAEEDAPEVQHDQQQPVKLPPDPGLHDPPMEPLPCREDPGVPPLELSDNMLYGYDFHFRRIFTRTIEGYYCGAWPGWSFIPRGVKKEMFETIKVYYTWPKSRGKEVMSVFNKMASEHIRRQFQFARALQEQNKRNRNADGFTSTSGYRGGCISTYTHRQRYIIEKKQKPTRLQLYERMHGRKNGSIPPGRTTITILMFIVVIFCLVVLFFLQEKFKDALQRAKDAARGDREALQAIDEDAIFDEVAGGTKGRRLGLGNIARAERCGVVDPCSSLTQENQELKETIRSLSQDNEATKAKQIPI
ncbi:hypothetical protein CCACVL1_16184 [Corchorus capsularis]|uniref:Transposase-associated domain-containing protein n=1 Tax=Corchorus capsularis TaxID=210143 RepID=A0A1R3HYF3_COCAP|nr:hypothetical protein CCACVL1_16184 [Corchorus capsularis]